MVKKDFVFKQGSTILLRLAILAMGAFILALCIFALPSLWRDVPADYEQIAYALYGLLIILYIAAVPFYFALYQALKLLNFIDKNQAFSKASINVLTKIKYAALTISAIFVASLPFFYVWAQNDDAPGLIVVGMIFAGASLTVSIFASLVQRLLKEVILIKSENDLTV